MKKEIPILFSTPMVQAILDGTKSMTRRVVKFPKDYTGGKVWPNDPFGLKYESNEFEGCVKRLFPKWEPGNLLWVRETYCPWNDGGGYAYKADGFIQRYGAWERDTPNKFHDVERIEKWKPSIFIPKEAARIWLQVESVRVERLQEISEYDARLEGMNLRYEKDEDGIVIDDNRNKEAFEELWQSINGPESWEANPWVWVVSFKTLSTTGRPEVL